MMEMKTCCEDTSIMNRTKSFLLLVIALCLMATVAPAQKKRKADSPEHDKIKNMVSFFQYMLNTLGSNKTPARDKEVLVKESYSKIFRDSKVQIEDDLDENRDVITNKDVPAYLKDVDFFFTDVKFEFTIEDITEGTQSNNNLYYKVSLLRNLSGTTIEGETVNNTIPRYIELNYDPKEQDLKIVSIYTHQFDERKALTYWWNNLSFEWQSIFKRKQNVIDSVTLDDLKKMTGIENLDISGNLYIQDIDPLAQLPGLKALNLSHTLIDDITPIRNLTGLTSLDIANTQVADLTALKYASQLERLSLGNTAITDISILEKMPKLIELDLTGDQIIDFSSLSRLQKLQVLTLKSSNIPFLFSIDSLDQLNELDLSNTRITNLNPIVGFKSLEVLHLDSTNVADITPLKQLQKLKVVYLNDTHVSELSALQGLPNLQRVYCDHTSVTQKIADAFMAANPGVLVIFDSEDLKTWWAALSPAWKNVLTKTAGLSTNPSKEELARVTNLDSVSLVNQSEISSLEPLRRLYKLKKINASHTKVIDLSPLQAHKEIRMLNVSHTQVSDLSIINQFPKLIILHADGTPVQSLHPELRVPSLEKLYLNETDITDKMVQRFLVLNPECLVVYKSSKLQSWWTGLPVAWKKALRAELGIEKEFTTEQLHHLIEGEELHFENVPVDDLSALSQFIRLKKLHFSETTITDLSPLSQFPWLTSLHASHSPIRNFDVLADLHELADLDISDTPLDNLEVVNELQNLIRLNCSGTPIRKLDELERLPNLQYLDCSNTAVRKLDPVSHLSLKKLKCYNTKINDRRIEDFKAGNPECEVTYYR